MIFVWTLERAGEKKTLDYQSMTLEGVELGVSVFVRNIFGID
jgi:hypothetical protein